jgi:hypothetical protein
LGRSAGFLAEKAVVERSKTGIVAKPARSRWDRVTRSLQ